MIDFSLKHIGDHKERLFGMLPSWMRYKPVISAVVESIGTVLQFIEDDIFDVATSETFALARGSRLDQWGLMFGVGPRRGISEADYRRLVQLAAQARRCTGTEDELTRLWQTATAPSTVEFRLAIPKCVVLTAWRDAYMDPAYARRAAAIIGQVAPTGAVVLVEAINTRFLGFSGRTRAPLALPFGSRNWPARIHPTR
jgi:hypothetical protein